MAVSDYLNILLAFLIYRPLKRVVVGRVRMHHDWSDLFGKRLDNRLARLKRRFGSCWTLPGMLTLLSFAACPWLHWSVIDPTETLRLVVGFAAVMLAWKSATIDVDLAMGRHLIIERWVVLMAAMGVLFYPGFLFLLLFAAVHFLRAWQHHQHLQIRLALFFLATWIGYLILSLVSAPSSMTVAGLFVTFVVTGSHYFVPGFAKLRLGPLWGAWIWRNRLNCLAMSAYMWGWCGFLPRARVICWLRPLRYLNLPIQLMVIIFELAAAALLFEPHGALAVLLLLAGFHLVVFILGGILFWQNTVMLLSLGGILVYLPEAITLQIFGSTQGILAGLLMFILPVLRIWSPQKLAWWDTPLIARTDWTVEGVSGKVYGLYNDFLEPNDRIFGNHSAYFLSQHKRLNRHLGQTSRWEIAEAIYDSLAAPERLEAVKAKLGQSAYDQELEFEHDRYMREFLTNFNLGRTKRICPRWLKAPGGQLFYWGRHPRFRGQEQVKRLTMRYREEIFDGQQIITLRDDFLKEIEIPVEEIPVEEVPAEPNR